ncbi:hypothetical protein AJ80_07316 [Polytolypa hystricis UAMH7299]|uniref:Serine/arginine repetitive matrix protein 1 n=1 Tax=Polytolypa hystricis (strain UAMH7299) TaxID=1447883 RepID=A0A2B7XPR7_POLH7|nr:hypothetical protein AJ80_07316 [Polytolypa hystricis UAMH7299]
MDRDRDRRYDEVRRVGGESYRPSGRRSPPPRPRSPFRPPADTWAPPGRGRPRSRSPDTFRRRSRTPPFRGGRDATLSYNPRMRSPPRRLSPGRDARRSPPPRPLPRRSRSPPRYPRERSPPLKRMREPSPGPAYNPRSPKRERMVSPMRGDRFDRRRSPIHDAPYNNGPPRHPIRTRSPSPIRRDIRRDTYAERSWRRRSPSPPMARSGYNSAQASTATSRRSSPPVQLSDRVPTPSGPSGRPSAYGPARAQYDSHIPTRSPSYRPRSPPPHISRVDGPPSMRPSPPRGPARRAPSPRLQEPSPRANIDRDRAPPARNNDMPTRPREPSAREPQNNNLPKQPPTQPQAFNKMKSASPPTGPTPPTAPAAANRIASTTLLAAPTRPKGVSGPSPPIVRDAPSPRDRVPSGPAARRPSHHGPPTGPRGSYPPPTPTSGYDSHRPPPTFRQGSGSSSSTTYPRTQRFTNYLGSIPSIIRGGGGGGGGAKFLPSGLEPGTEKRLVQLEADKERLLEQIAEKQKVKRAGLREWERLSRESTTGALRSELAEGHLQRMTEGDVIGGAAF